MPAMPKEENPRKWHLLGHCTKAGQLPWLPEPLPWFLPVVFKLKQGIQRQHTEFLRAEKHLNHGGKKIPHGFFRCTCFRCLLPNHTVQPLSPLGLLHFLSQECSAPARSEPSGRGHAVQYKYVAPDRLTCSSSPHCRTVSPLHPTLLLL